MNMVMRMRLAIVGHFGGNKNYNDGQTIKTISLYEGLKNSGLSCIDIIDTYYIRHNPLRFLLCFSKSMVRDKKYIVIVSKNGRRFLFPIMTLMSRFFGKEIYHYAIGGRLADEIKSGSLSISQVKSFSENWVESITIVDKLNKLGVTNVKYIPNFKNITPLNENELILDFHEPYCFCTFSRVMEEKGITDAINAIKEINEEFGRMIVKLDIYGPIEETYRAKFEKLISDNSSVQYLGIIPANKSVVSLKKYFMLLFPTFWIGEGMPGTIIDAFCSGVPIIARHWAYCDEMITDNINGYVYDFNKPECLKEKITYAITHVEQTVEMRKNCIKCSGKYRSENVIQQIRNKMEL